MQSQKEINWDGLADLLNSYRQNWNHLTTDRNVSQAVWRWLSGAGVTSTECFVDFDEEHDEFVLIMQDARYSRAARIMLANAETLRERRIRVVVVPGRFVVLFSMIMPPVANADGFCVLPEDMMTDEAINALYQQLGPLVGEHARVTGREIELLTPAADASSLLFRVTLHLDFSVIRETRC